MKKYNFKSIILQALPIVLVGFSILSCNDWTDMEAKAPVNKDVSQKTAAYYKQLREFKKTDHSVTFGWFGNWTGKGSCLSNCLAGLPDSVDMVSIWGSWNKPNKDMIADRKFVQEVKGTRVLVTILIMNIGDGLNEPKDSWGWKDGNSQEAKAAQKLAIQKYAKSIADSITKYHYDGFDLDIEPNYGGAGNVATSNGENLGIFCREMGKYIGPKSGTNRIFTVDGEPDILPSDVGGDISYFISQAYNTHNNSDLQRRMSSLVNNYKSVMTPEECLRKFIVTETFEQYALDGGAPFTTDDGQQIHSLEGMARWNPIYDGHEYRKGGVGAFHMEYEYEVKGHNVTYPAYRSAIQLMNPAVK